MTGFKGRGFLHNISLNCKLLQEPLKSNPLTGVPPLYYQFSSQDLSLDIDFVFIFRADSLHSQIKTRLF